MPCSMASSAIESRKTPVLSTEDRTGAGIREPGSDCARAGTDGAARRTTAVSVRAVAWALAITNASSRTSHCLPDGGSASRGHHVRYGSCPISGPAHMCTLWRIRSRTGVKVQELHESARFGVARQLRGIPTMIAGNSVLRRCAEPLLNVARPASAGQRAAADVRAERPQPPQNWTALPVGARCYIAAVTGLGAAAVMLALQEISERDAPLLTALAVLSLITAFAKTTLSVPGSASTLSFCYVIDFTALLVLGPAAATLTSALGVWAQGTFRARRRGPRYRTWFSIGALALTVQAAWLI